jgi:hypothetical protein
MAITKAKEQILCKHESHSSIEKLRIEPSDIMPIVNEAWSKSFATVKSNIKAIAERGWFPYNQKLLQHPDIMATKPLGSLTDSQETYWSVGHKVSPSSQISDVTMPSFSPKYVSRKSLPREVNLDKGMGMHVLSHIGV